MSVRLASAGLSDRGQKRPHNEDSILLDGDRGIFAVADGMGGHAAGEIASKIAIDAVREVFGNDEAKAVEDEETLPSQVVEERLKLVVDRSNVLIAERIEKNPECSGMGTTLVTLVVRDGRYWIGHVGDSRAYLLSDAGIRQLTTDHSFVNELVRLGMLSEEEAAHHPRRNVVTRALVGGQNVRPDISEGSFTPGEIVLLCSDGLNTMLGDEQIHAIVARNRDDLDTAARELVDAANAAGGEDNVTVILARAIGNGVDGVADGETAPSPL